MSAQDRDKRSKSEQLLADLAQKIADLTAEIAALTRQRDRTRELHELEEKIEKLKLEKDRLIEANDRKIRDTEHSTGLMRKQVEAERAAAEKKAELAAAEAKLQVREENLKADRDRFANEVKFQREFLEREVENMKGLIVQILERVPVVEIKAGGQASARTRAKADSE